MVKVLLRLQLACRRMIPTRTAGPTGPGTMDEFRRFDSVRLDRAFLGLTGHLRGLVQVDRLQ